MRVIHILLVLISIILIAEVGFAGERPEYDAKGRRDPFEPLISKDGMYASDADGVRGMKDIRLEGIVWEAAKSSIAIINGEIVEEGDVIGVVKVLKIEKDAVLFDVEGQDVRIELVSE